MRLPGTLEGFSVPGKGKIGVPGTLGPFSVPGSLLQAVPVLPDLGDCRWLSPKYYLNIVA